MIHLLIFISACIFAGTPLTAGMKKYQFCNEPIDVVIPCTEKDLDTLELCIAGIRTNCPQIRRVIVVSARSLTLNAEWFDERNYPFKKEDVEFNLIHGAYFSPEGLNNIRSRLGWYYQQLLKFYAPFVIPNISSNVLILDSDTIFLNPIKFLDSHFAGLYNPGSEYHLPYFEHMKKLIPHLRMVYPHVSGISHHMLFQQDVLKDLFLTVEKYHGIPFWQAFCHCINRSELTRGMSLASEYEIYFAFVFTKTHQVHIRNLKWTNTSSINQLEKYKAEGYHYISCHSYLRK